MTECTLGPPHDGKGVDHLIAAAPKRVKLFGKWRPVHHTHDRWHFWTVEVQELKTFVQVQQTSRGWPFVRARGLGNMVDAEDYTTYQDVRKVFHGYEAFVLAEFKKLGALLGYDVETERWI